jgi:hypothetical protein
MAKILTFEIPENEYNEYKSFLEMAVVEMRKSRDQMKIDQAEIELLDKDIEQLRLETAEIKAQSDVTLNALVNKYLKAA